MVCVSGVECLCVMGGADLHPLVRFWLRGGYVCLWVRLGDVVKCVLWGTFVALVFIHVQSEESLCCRGNFSACAVWPWDIRG